MSETLFPFQRVGAEWLSRRKTALLADEMGLGKSAQVIHALTKIGARNALILCPAVARVNWQREFQKFGSHLVPSIFEPAEKARLKDLEGRPSPPPGHALTLVSSYDMAVRHRTHLSKLGPWDALVLDECHFLKSKDARRTKEVYGSKGLVHEAARTWALSGTPAPNHPGELWTIFRAFGLTDLPHLSFVNRYCETYQSVHGLHIAGARSAMAGELRSVLSQTMLRRMKEEVMSELPPIFYQDLAVEAGVVDLQIEPSFFPYIFPHDRTAELLAKLQKEEALLHGMGEVAGLATIPGIKGLEALAQSVSTLRRYTGIQKVKACVELIKSELDAKAYDKIVVFAIHRDVIEGMRRELARYGVVTLYGGTQAEKRQQNIDKFQKDPRTRIFIGNIQACGTAVNLTAAHNVLFVEQDWVPGNNAQAAMRCHRIGQANPVTVRFAGLADSIDEAISRALRRKTKDLREIFGSPSLSEWKNQTMSGKHLSDAPGKTEEEDVFK